MADSLQFDFAIDREAQLNALLKSVLQDGGGPWPIADDERRLLEILRHHRGAARAIKGGELASRLKTSERNIKALVQNLAIPFAVPIGSSRVPPFGYYLILTAEELYNTTNNYKSEMRMLGRRIRVLEGPHAAAEYCGQLSLEMEKA
jgi:hypothetical protein